MDFVPQLYTKLLIPLYGGKRGAFIFVQDGKNLKARLVSSEGAGFLAVAAMIHLEQPDFI